jgi:choline-sulfatase
MKPSSYLCFASLLMPFVGHCQKLPDKPNILIIMTDQQSSEALGFNIGKQYLKTPNMDYLAEHGITFSNAYCANPLCIPSRNSLFTGRYPHELGIQVNDDSTINPDEFPILGSHFKNAGYSTGYFGKWHISFDHRKKDVHGFSEMADIRNTSGDSILSGVTISFLKEKQNNPFFAVVSFCNPHNICEWARGDKLPDGGIGNPPSAENCPPLRPNFQISENETDILKLMRTSYQASRVFPVSGFSNEKWRQYRWAYYRMIEKTDTQIGKILAWLKESGLDKNTIIVFLSDHGDCQGAHHWNQKTVFYEEAVKVPFIISYKGIQAGKSDHLVQTGIDLMPTLCDLAGIPVPGTVRGISLKPYLISLESAKSRPFIVVADKMQQGEPVNGNKPIPEGRMLRNNRFKYWIYDLGRQRETLYDLQNDPGEMVNLAADPKYKADLANCRKQLYGWAKENNDSFIKNLIP